MALLGHDARALCRARARGVAFDRVLTVGRLNLVLRPDELSDLRSHWLAGVTGQPESSRLENYRIGDFADDFLRECLGATSVTTVDHSAYDGANYVHDLNQPLPSDLTEQFDAVIEAGTLEHVFNFPVAIASLMTALKVGGSIFLTTPANNLCGHGFYQFSPELMFRIFSPENGFAIKKVVFLEARFPAVESTPLVRTRRVSDPLVVGRRVGLRSKRPVMMALEAIRIEGLRPFATAPLQSDYVAKWEGAGTGDRGGLRAWAMRLPPPIRARVAGYYHLWEYSFLNKRSYHRDEN